jgi:sarcosine oxidase gamma subunit
MLEPRAALAHRRNGNLAVLASPALAVREFTDLALFHLTVDFARHCASLEAALGVAAPEPGKPRGEAFTAIWQTPTDILLAGPRDALAPKIDVLRNALANNAAILDDVTHAMPVIDLEGPAAEFVCPLRGGKSNVGRLADLRVTQLFLGPGHIRLFVDYSDADYLWAWLEARLPALNAV